MEKKSSLNNKAFSRYGRVYVILIVLVFLPSCSFFGKSDVDFESVEINYSLSRLDQELFRCQSPTEISKIIDENRDVFNLYLQLDKLPDDSVLAQILFERISNKSVDSFYQQAKSTFGDFKLQDEQITDLFKHVKYYYPDFTPPAIATIFTAFLSTTDIIVSKGHIIIGLEYFIGPEAMYVQNDPEYILQRYRPEYLVPMFIGLGVSNFYNESNHEDHTLVSDMIFFGKAHYFLSQMIFEIDDSMNLGFSEEELAYMTNNEKGLWSYFVENELLFESNEMETSKYLSERPKIVEIAPDCPGRLGRWLGFQIVKSYMSKNKEISLPNLMAEKDAQMIFRESGYNPSK